MKKLTLLSVLSLGLLSGCSDQALVAYQGNKPTFNLYQYFSGHTEAWGMLQDRSGQVTRRFTVSMDGEKKQDAFYLYEHFVFDDGERTQRTWVIKSLGSGKYEGRAGDIKDIALGEEVGNALRWHYQLFVPYKGKKYLVSFDDWMYRLDDQHVMNVSSMKKFGLNLGKLTIFFQKKPIVAATKKTKKGP